ncbi:MAG: hypothetical protein PVG22_06695 [Chromatiales bacterium]|jgi:hypothetical protein
MMYYPLFLVMVLAITIAPSLYADEVYEARLQQSNERIADLIYEIELGSHAVWVLSDGSTRYYIEGLAGVYSGRDKYHGYYLSYKDGEKECQEPMLDHNGMQLFRWGRLEIEWQNDNAFVIYLSPCNEAMDPALTIVGKGL